MGILDVTPVNLYTFLIALGLGLGCDSLLAVCFCLVPFPRYYQVSKLFSYFISYFPKLKEVTCLPV